MPEPLAVIKPSLVNEYQLHSTHCASPFVWQFVVQAIYMNQLVFHNGSNCYALQREMSLIKTFSHFPRVHCVSFRQGLLFSSFVSYVLIYVGRADTFIN